MAKFSSYVKLLRPVHWSKNVFVFAALIFAWGTTRYGLDALGRTVWAFVCFCLLSSAAYVLNDIHDIVQDRLHPRKRLRPLASDEVPKTHAWAICVVLMVLGMFGAYALNVLFGLVATAYLILNLTYSWWLKDKVIVDVMCIAAGFVLRAMAGVAAINVELSPWLVVCTFTLCLFVGFGKRRCELAAADDDHDIASDHRPVLARYSLELLSHLLTISAAVAVVTFLLYTMDAQTSAKFGTNYLIYTVPLVIYGIFRFAVLIETGKFDGPIELFIADPPFQMTIALWLIMVIIVVHKGPAIHGFILHLR